MLKYCDSFAAFDAVIFDMDGVLIDSERIWQTRQPDFILQLFPDFPTETSHQFAGRTAKGVFEILSPYNIQNISEESFLERFREFGSREIYSEVTAFEGVEELLQRLHKNPEISLALGSSSLIQWVKMAMEKTGFEKYFSAICSAEEIGGVSKPAPDIFLYAAKKLGVAPEKCLVIEDANAGVQAAKAAGMTVWAFRNGVNHQQDLSKANHIFSSFKTLL